MKLIVIGDSITKGTYTGIEDPYPCSIASPNYAEILKEKLKADSMINYGTNGISYSSLSPVLSEYSLAKVCNTFVQGDIITIACGTNDFGTDVPLGNKEDFEDFSFYGAVDFVLKTLKQKNKNSKIFVITPIERYDKDKNKINLHLNNYREALTNKANKYGLFVIDGSKLNLNSLDSEIRKNIMLDGVHINTFGHKLFGEYLYSEIKKVL